VYTSDPVAGRGAGVEPAGQSSGLDSDLLRYRDWHWSSDQLEEPPMSVGTRESLLDAAERAILAEGFARASTRRIAQEAGVPLSLLHYHFGGKEALLIALVERTRSRRAAAVRESLAGDSPPAVRAAAALDVARQSFAHDQAGSRLIVEMTVAALHNAKLRREMERLYGEAMTALSRTVAALTEESGRPMHPGVRPEAVASLILATSTGLDLQRMLGFDSQTCDGAFDVFGELLLMCLASPGERSA
jgi:AcrR family transcriptional regulator